MYLFQIEWLEKGLTGFQQDTLLRSFLYNLKVEHSYHLFCSVDRLSFTFISTEVDLTKYGSLYMKFKLLQKVQSAVNRFLISAVPRDYKRIKQMYSTDEKINRHSFTKKALKDTSVCSIKTNFHGSYRPVRLELDVKSFSKLVRVSSTEVILDVSPNISLQDLAKHLKLNIWVVSV